jgi:hypothetical protein
MNLIYNYLKKKVHEWQKYLFFIFYCKFLYSFLKLMIILFFKQSNINNQNIVFGFFVENCFT